MMLDPRKAQEMEQARTQIVETLPPLWWGLYKGMRGEGFTDDQAMGVLLEYVRTTCSVPLSGEDPLPQDEEED
jgi:hypothetical protein